MREALIAQVRRAVPFDWFVFVSTDPQTAVGAAPLAEVPASMMAALPRLILAKYTSQANRWTTLAAGQVALLHQVTGRSDQPWPRMLAEHDIADVASTVFRDRYGCWGFLDLWRRSEFTAQEAARLARLAGPATGALRREQASTFAAAPAAPDRAEPLVLLLDRELTVLGQTPATHEYLRTLIPPPQGQAPVPAGAYNVAAQLMAVAGGIDGQPARARVHLAAGLWLTLRAAPVGDQIAVTIEQSAPGERADLYARACGLSGRERELLSHLADGMDTREIGRAMFLSEHTVQDHLKSIFTKTGTRSRKALLSRAVGA